MNRPQVKVIRFENADVIATSGISGHFFLSTEYTRAELICPENNYGGQHFHVVEVDGDSFTTEQYWLYDAEDGTYIGPRPWSGPVNMFEGSNPEVGKWYYRLDGESHFKICGNGQ